MVAGRGKHGRKDTAGGRRSCDRRSYPPESFGVLISVIKKAGAVKKLWAPDE